VVERQRVEILKALMGETRVLLLDEPTAVLAPQEVEGLFAVLRQVARAGAGIVLVAHKLDEVLAAADRVTVLRRGRWVLTREAAEVSARELAEAMVGTEVGMGGAGAVAAGPGVEYSPGPGGEHSPRPGGEYVPGSGGEYAPGPGGEGAAGPEGAARGDEVAEGEVVAELRDVTVTGGGTLPLRSLSMEVRRGEILGIAGVGGNGQRTLAAVLAGMLRPDSGEVELPEEVGWIPQDRTEEGLVNEFTISENVAFALHGRGDHRHGPWLDWAGVEETAAGLVRDMDVRADSPAAAAAVLSGGNQQKVVTGREFLRSGELLVAESPTRGLDVKATVAVRERIAKLVKSGERPPGVVLISADLDEILELSHRIAVMVRGRLIPVPREDHNPTAIGELMLSARGTDAR